MAALLASDTVHFLNVTVDPAAAAAPLHVQEGECHGLPLFRGATEGVRNRAALA